MSLADKTGADVITITIETRYGEYSYNVRLLSIHRFFELGAMIPDADRSQFEGIKPGTSEREIVDREGFQAEMARVGEMRAAYRVAAALHGGGEAFPDDVQNNDKARGDWVLKHMAVDIRTAIANFIGQAIDGRTATLKSSADRFRGGLVSRNGSGDTAGARLDAEPVGTNGG